jgi:phosphomannomutase
LAVDNNANIQHHQQQPCLNINLFNECNNSNDILNHLVSALNFHLLVQLVGQHITIDYLKCGADHVKVMQTTPINLPTFADNKIRKYCSFDGDADRIVYYYLDKEKRFHLLDGDKISTLVIFQTQS